MPKSNNQSKEHHRRETTTSYKKTIVQFLSIKNNLHWLYGVESKRLFHSKSARQTIKKKAPPQRQGMGQSTHTAALQLAQRTVVNIIKTETPTRETNIAAPTLGSSHASHHPRHHHQKNKRPSLTIFKHSPPPFAITNIHFAAL